MAVYDNLPLNAPTKIGEDADTETWATRTLTGGTVETRIKAGGATDVAQQRDARLSAAIPILRGWAQTARSTTVTSGNAVAVLQQLLNNQATFYENFADLLQSKQ